jgi:tRNA A-37 threonylcarbamoyl transferase component Bud32
MDFDEGDLELGEPLGRGGQATVRRAVDRRTGQVVAAKILEPRVWNDPRLRRRLERELATLQRVEHPGVVRVVGTREVDGRGVLLMELADRGTLADQIALGPLAPLQALAILADVAAGLDAAHRGGIVHRDVTSSNVLLRADGSAVLADFGLALGPEDAPTTTDALTCTPAYVAPEVAGGAAGSPAADRYSLAVVAFEALTGQRPFEAETAVGLLHAHVNAPIPAASECLRTLPRTLDPAFGSLLAKDPDVRPASSRALIAALEDGFSPAAVREPKRARPARRRWLIATAGGGTVAAIAATLVVAGPGLDLPNVGGEAASVPVATVPGPDGGPRPAQETTSDRISGVSAGIPALFASVAGVEVVVLESEADVVNVGLRAAQEDEGAEIDRLRRDGVDVAEIARGRDGRAQGVVGLGEPPRARTVVLTGAEGAVETYAAALAAALADDARAPSPSEG